jgi:nitrate reductase delta subunit
MVDLTDMYASKGLFINKKELPDYLPLFLEYLSLCDVKEAKESLGDSIDIIALIGGHLKKNKSIAMNLISKYIDLYRNALHCPKEILSLQCRENNRKKTDLKKS